jgi:hypothetical protein
MRQRAIPAANLCVIDVPDCRRHYRALSTNPASKRPSESSSRGKKLTGIHPVHRHHPGRSVAHRRHGAQQARTPPARRSIPNSRSSTRNFTARRSPRRAVVNPFFQKRDAPVSPSANPHVHGHQAGRIRHGRYEGAGRPCASGPQHRQIRDRRPRRQQYARQPMAAGRRACCCRKNASFSTIPRRC